MYGDRQVDNFAAYVQDEIEVSPLLTVTAGLRLDHNLLVNGKRQSQVSPKLAAVYRVRENLTLRALVGQAFRAPSIAERFFQKEISGGTNFLPNPGLRAERMNSVEIGGRLQVGRWLDVDAALFHYQYNDMIYWVALNPEGFQEFLFQVRNLNSALMRGLEVGVNVYWQPHLRLHAGYTYLDAEDRSTGRTDDFLAYRIRHSLSFGGNLTWKKFDLNLDGRFNGRVDEVFLYPYDRPEAYVLLNAKLTAHLTSALGLSLSCSNILDSQYEELARYRMPGRHWIAGVSWEF
jgi:outer membrane receptor protein involved in Fe transport